MRTKIKETKAGIALQLAKKCKNIELCDLMHRCQGERESQCESLVRDLNVVLLSPAGDILATNQSFTVSD